MRWVKCSLLLGVALGLLAGVGGCPVESRQQPESCTVDSGCPEGQGCVSGFCRPVDCRVDRDCEVDQACRDHECVDSDSCLTDADCDSDQICDAGLCRPGCRSDAGCAQGRCDPDSRTCVTCLEIDDCELGELCVEGACLPGCTGDRDCPSGLSCFEDEGPHGLCAECLADSDCAGGERCLAHRCATTCADDSDCAADEVCEAGGCRVGCRDDQSCPGGHCDPDGRTCVECLNVDDCVLGQLCIDGACTPGCKTDRDCPAGQICDQDVPPHGQCTDCVNPDDCPQDGPRACVTPVALDFGSVPPDQTADLSFSISSCGQVDLTLTDLSLAPQSSGDFSLLDPPALPHVLAIGASVTVQVRYSPGQVGDDGGGVDIYSDDPASDPDTGLTGHVLLTGRSDEFYCDLQVSPPALDFGVIRIGQGSQLALGLSNLGNEDCVLDQVVFGSNTPAGEFSLVQPVAAGTVVPPGDAVEVAVAYEPTDAGADSGRLDILSNDKDGPVTSVGLQGFGQLDQDGPVAVCSVSPLAAQTLGTLIWHGDQSFDPGPGRTITQWTWTQLSFPTGTGASLASLTASDRSTATDLAGVYAAELVVTNDLGQTSPPCTAAAQVVPGQDLWIEMYWQHAGDDMDLHLLAPNGVKRSSTDCYYANCSGPFGILDWGVTGDATDNPHLALDDIPGTGPEIIYLAAPAAGVYTVFVHDYPGTVYNEANQVTVNVWINGTMTNTFTQAITGEDIDWDVCQIDWPSGTVTPL